VIASKVGEVLHFLTNIAEAFRRDSMISDQTAPLDTESQAELVDDLRHDLAAIEDALRVTTAGSLQRAEAEALSHALIIFARILQFTLGFPTLWNPKSREASETLCAPVFNLALVSAIFYS
jgi:hypothetical protein